MNNKVTILLFFFITTNIYSQNIFNSEPEVRVRIIDSLEKLELSFDNRWTLMADSFRKEVAGENGQVIFSIVEGKIKIQNESESIDTGTDRLVLVSGNDNGTLSISDVPYGAGWWWEGKEDRIYEGEVSLYVNDSKMFEVVISLPLEEYLKGVVPYEMGNDSPLESLKAQAVAARSEAVIALTSKLYSGEYYDLTSDVECQVFSGNHKRTHITDNAVIETRGMILSENGKPIHAYYASNCGGHSELIKNVWPDRPNPMSYQKALKDTEDRDSLDLSEENTVRDWIFSQPNVFCNPNLGTKLPAWSQKNFRWEKNMDIESISKMIAGDKNLGFIKEIIPLKRGRSGRMYHARFVFEKDSFEVMGELNIRQLWHPSLRSACFVIDNIDNQFVLNGAGWGHGVGMCQSGAIAQAKNGTTFRCILKHYYQKAMLIALYKP